MDVKSKCDEIEEENLGEGKTRKEGGGKERRRLWR